MIEDTLDLCYCEYHDEEFDYDEGCSRCRRELEEEYPDRESED